MKNVIRSFLKTYGDQKKPLLLALSGGPDSLALLYLLLELTSPASPHLGRGACDQQQSIQLGIAHVNHRWRSESDQEAFELQQLAEQLGLPFHLKTLDPSLMEGNLESACRQERLRFFSELCREFHYQAVLLGHHADDQAETILKRILEGSCLANLSGLQEEIIIDGMKIWRPLLTMTKKAIGDWLKERNLSAFEDSGNHDPKFLRGKFRSQIIPNLSREFGKEICSSLCAIGDEAQELKCYLSEKVEKYLARIEHGKFGVFLDLSIDCPPSIFELKHLIRVFCHQENFFLSRELLESTTTFLLSKAANRQTIMGKNQLYIDRQRLFLLGRQRPCVNDETRTNGWELRLFPVTQHSVRLNRSDWKNVWKGQVSVVLPAADYEIATIRSKTSPHHLLDQTKQVYPKKASINEWWTAHKVPAFLRPWIPVVWESGVIRHEFLTGKIMNPPKENEPCTLIVLSFPLSI